MNAPIFQEGYFYLDRQEYLAGNRQEVHRRQGDRGTHRPWQTSSHQVKFQLLAFHI